METTEKKLEWKMLFTDFFFHLCKTIWENQYSEYIPEDVRYRTLQLNSELSVPPKKISLHPSPYRVHSGSLFPLVLLSAMGLPSENTGRQYFPLTSIFNRLNWSS